MSQMRLLGQRRFWPLFWTQFLGAFNDNLFKNALTILIAYKSMTLMGLASGELVILSSIIFIVPFALFSATAGQISDAVPKSSLMRWIKFAEIIIMGMAAVGFLTDSLALLLVTLFFMGLQSAFFGPAKYSILPELLPEDELVGGNALVETGTFLSILLGMVTSGALMTIGETGTSILGITVVAIASAGFVSSLFIVRTPAGAPNLRGLLNPITPLVGTYRAVRTSRPVFLSVLGISWFWFFGIAVITVLPIYAKEMLFGDERVLVLFWGFFSVGVAVGSLLCERLSGRKLELGLTPLGSIGISLFAFDLFLAGNPYADHPAPAALLGIADFFAAPGSIRIAADMFLISVFSGFYTVPLYTMIQQRSPTEIRSRVVAGNNILNAGFMVASGGLLMGLTALDFSIPQIFAVLALLNAAVAIYIYTVIPEFLLRFVAWMVASIMYRVRATGRDNIPDQGAVLLTCNHVSFIDWLFVASVCKRPARFVMHHTYFRMPVVGFLFRDAKVIPIAPAHEDKDTMAQAFDRIAEELEAGEVVCIFPEGKLTRDGRLNPFRRGVEDIVQRTPVPVVPMALEGMWGSFFSHKDAPPLSKPFRRFWSRVKLVIGEPIAPDGITAEKLAAQTAQLGGWEVPPEAPPRGSGKAVPQPSNETP